MLPKRGRLGFSFLWNIKQAKILCEDILSVPAHYTWQANHKKWLRSVVKQQMHSAAH
jgi:hypothetical protein